MVIGPHSPAACEAAEPRLMSLRLMYRTRKRPGAAGSPKARRVVHALLLCGAVAVAGCGKPAGRAERGDPASVLKKVRSLHRQHRYMELESLVEPQRAVPLIDTLMSVDRLLEAGRRLRQAAEEKLGPTAAVVCNLDPLADFLGPFSRQVRIVSQRIDGDEAYVAYQVGDRVPIERARMKRISGAWRYVPDEPDPQLSKLLLQLSENIDALYKSVRAGKYDEREFIEEYKSQVLEPLRAHWAKANAERKDQG